MYTNNKQTHCTSSVKNSSSKVFMPDFEFLTMVEAGKDIIWVS